MATFTCLAVSSVSATSSCCMSECRNSRQITACKRLNCLSLPNVSKVARLLTSTSYYTTSLRHIIRQRERRGVYFSQQRVVSTARCDSTSNGGTEEKIPFGYTRKDVLLIGLGLTVFGIGLKYGLEFFGVDSLKAGNVVQVVMVAGLTVGWISSYIFRVSTKEMTYAKQLKDYENKVMEKRLEELPEAELETMLAQIEEEKRRIKENRDRLSS